MIQGVTHEYSQDLQRAWHNREIQKETPRRTSFTKDLQAWQGELPFFNFLFDNLLYDRASYKSFNISGY